MRNIFILFVLLMIGTVSLAYTEDQVLEKKRFSNETSISLVNTTGNTDTLSLAGKNEMKSIFSARSGPVHGLPVPYTTRQMALKRPKGTTRTLEQTIPLMRDGIATDLAAGFRISSQGSIIVLESDRVWGIVC